MELQTPRLPGAKLSEVAALACWETVDKDHGRFEIRRYYQSDELDWFDDKSKWEGERRGGLNPSGS